jgi:hypothetical protein
VHVGLEAVEVVGDELLVAEGLGCGGVHREWAGEPWHATRGNRAGEREPGGGGVGGATTVGEIRGSSGGTPGAVEACERGHQGAICGLDLVDLASRKGADLASRSHG